MKSAKVSLGRTTDTRVSRYLTGKFCEHLGSNINNGMCAQILRNPAFAEYPFFTGRMSPDGMATFKFQEEEIAEDVKRLARDYGFPGEDAELLVESRRNATAFPWLAVGQARTCADVGPNGGRAQWVEATSAGQGLAQWFWLPLHRVRDFGLHLVVRATAKTRLSIQLRSADGQRKSEAVVRELGDGWNSIDLSLSAAGFPADQSCRLSLLSTEPSCFVFSRATLYPADHVDGSDPDVIRLLKESRLPVLRWPGGNFVSAYDWRDGVGPMDQRPTRPNWAWAGLEPNIFGTDEYISFCRHAGCEPWICVNGGNGTAEDAGRWVEYCNGSPSTPMGSLRAANGHPEPFCVEHWEIGNELWGRWQAHWATPKAYVDRYRRFAEEMLRADPTIKLYACGEPMNWGQEWNDTLFKELGADLRSTTDHVLLGGNVTPEMDPLELFREFMLFPDLYEERYRRLKERMEECGCTPKLAITELQIFARLPGAAKPESPMTRETMVNPASQAEALYSVLHCHIATRLAPFLDIITHSATVNHGGGLRKEHESVYANPCHYAQSLFAELSGGRLCDVKVDSPLETVQRDPMLPRDKASTPMTYPVLDVVAARRDDGVLLLSLVNRGTEPLAVDLQGLSGKTSLVIVSAEKPWSRNNLTAPELIVPRTTDVTLEKGGLVLPPWSVGLLRQG